MPYTWDQNDKFDEKSNRSNMDHIINNIKVDGHYCSGNIAEFWSMPDDERMYAHEVMLDQARGKIPMIAGCHHQSVKQVVSLAKHAQDIGYDFIIVLTPYVAARDDETVYQFYEYICANVDIGIILFNNKGLKEWEFVNKDANDNIGFVSWSRIIEDEIFIEKFKYSK